MCGNLQSIPTILAGIVCLFTCVHMYWYICSYVYVDRYIFSMNEIMFINFLKHTKSQSVLFCTTVSHIRKEGFRRCLNRDR